MGLYNEYEKMLDETKLVVNILLNNSLNDKEIAKRTGLNLAKVTNYLTNHGLIISAFCLDQNDSKERIKAETIYETVQKLRATINQDKEVKEDKPLANPNAKINLGLLYNDEKKQIKFLTFAILTFRVKLETLSELLNTDKEYINAKIQKYNPQYYLALNYLFNEDYFNQEIARRDFLNFYYQLLKAILKNDTDDINKKMQIINDSKFKTILEKTDNIKYTDEEIETIIEFQLKYAFNSNVMAKLLKYQFRQSFYKRIVNFFEHNPQFANLEIRYKHLMNYTSKILNKGVHR